jgi:MFS family permease
MFLYRWFTNPNVGPEVKKSNFLFVQIDAIGIGLANAAAPFLPVFLTRLNATNFQVGLLTSMPALTGLLLAIIVGRFLQTRRNILPYFSLARLLVILSYALTGLVPWVVPKQYLVFAILAIWAVATLPQTVVNILFSVVMNQVAGANGRFELMSRRWSIMGVTTSLAVVLTGYALDTLGFPFNYQLVFLALSVGGLISFIFSSRLDLPASTPIPQVKHSNFLEGVSSYFKLIGSEKPFLQFALRRFVFLAGISLATPLFPLFYVRKLHADDAWIGLINTASTAVMVIGYFLWVNRSRRHGTRMVLLWTTFGLSLYPALVAISGRVEWVAFFAGLSGIFQAGLDLVFFDELMRTIPPEYSATFVSFAQSMQYLSTMIAPVAGTMLADWIGLSGALVVAGIIRLIGFILFLTARPLKPGPLPA